MEEKILEGNEAVTSTANPTEENIDLATVPVPTPEELQEANLTVEEEKNVDSVPAENNEKQPEPEKSFTQSQVNELVGKTRTETRNKTFEYIYGRYGVQDEEGLDSLVGNAQRYDSLKEEFDTERANWKNQDDSRNSEFLELKEKVALMESGIDRERYDDAKYILKGKGLEITSENIAQELMSHPEWKKEIKVYNAKKPQTSEISVLGNEKTVPEPTESEEEVAMGKYFKV